MSGDSRKVGLSNIHVQMSIFRIISNSPFSDVAITTSERFYQRDRKWPNQLLLTTVTIIPIRYYSGIMKTPEYQDYGQHMSAEHHITHIAHVIFTSKNDESFIIHYSTYAIEKFTYLESY